jgi:hypothetical protein
MIGQLWVTMRYVHVWLSFFLPVIAMWTGDSWGRCYVCMLFCLGFGLSLRVTKICTVCAVVIFVYKVWDYDCLLFLSIGTSGTWSISFFFPHGSTAFSGQGLLIVEALEHNQTPCLVGLLWMSIQPVAEMSAWQRTTLIRDKPPCPWQDSNLKSQPASGRRPTA